MATPTKRDKVMFTFVQTESIEFQEKAVTIAKNIILRKMFQTPHDVIQFCKWTDTLSPCYQDFRELDKDTINDMNKFIVESKVYTLSATESDWIKALHTSIKYALEVAEGPGAAYNSLQIILFTSLDADAAKPKIIEKCVQNLHEKNRIRCYILGPELEIPLDFKFVESIPELLANDTSLIKQYGNKAEPLLHFVNKTNSLTCGLEVGQHLITAYKPLFKNPQAWKTNFTIGDKIALPVIGMRYSASASEPRMKAPEKDIFSMPETEKKKTEAADSSDDSDKEDNSEVYLTRQEKAAHKMMTLRCLDLLFVINASDINEVYNMGTNTMYLLFAESSHAHIFSAFIEVLHETNSVGIARKCYNKGNFPKLVALIPRPDLRKHCLQLMEMPYFEHVKNPLLFIDSKTDLWNITSEPENKYPELKEPIHNYLNALCIDENQSLIDRKTYLPAHLVHNPKFKAFYECVLQRILDRECELTPQFEIKNYFDQVTSLANAVEEARQNIFG